jgi:mannosyltransferase OCH1-like enzyme
MQIPKIIHQSWKSTEIPERWRDAVASVRRMHPDWEYRLWTDDDIDAYVASNYPGFYPVFVGFNRHIMRMDAFRYILMSDFGGLYCDLDYEFVRPYPYGETAVQLSYEYQRAYGDDADQVANYVFASVPGHPLWADALADLEANPPQSTVPGDVCILTGPGLVTRILFGNPDRYPGVVVTDQPVLSPRRVHGRYERKHYTNSGITYGFHHGWGSWKERFNGPYIRRKLGKYLRYLRKPHL